MTQPHSTGAKLPIGRPFANGHDPRRNAGGRPQGLSRLAREAVADGRDLIDFYLAIFRGDAKAIHARKISLHDRMQAAEWLAERGWGRAPVVVDVPEETQVHFNVQEFNDALAAWARRLPPSVREELGAFMDAEFERGIEADIAEVDKQIADRMPQATPRED